MLHRGCTSEFPGDIDETAKEKIQSGNVDQLCGDSEEKFDNGKNSTILNQRCGSVCDMSLCNNDMPSPNTGLSTGAIIGIVCGSLLGVALIVGIFIFFVK